MIKISSVGKYLDQPLLTAKINKQVPTVLTLASSAFLAKEVHDSPKESRKKKGIQLGIILAATTISAINASKIASFLTKRPMSKNIKQIYLENEKVVEWLLENNNLPKEVTKILNKSKNKILGIKEVDILNKNLSRKDLNRLIPDPENITSKDIFREIGWLSIFGAVPVAGGIAGGIIADKATEKHWENKVSNKIKEGLYQYLANIFMCNIGAGAALGLLERFNIRSKSARCVGMVSGIILTGVVGGSAIANYISNKFINPLLSKHPQKETRTPELLDLGLHTDDIATVSLLSGLKWIEPSLPLLYAVSGYRAGIGYRNNSPDKEKQSHFLCEKC